jgi:hypothetical protein
MAITQASSRTRSAGAVPATIPQKLQPSAMRPSLRAKATELGMSPHPEDEHN